MKILIWTVLILIILLIGYVNIVSNWAGSFVGEKPKPLIEFQYNISKYELEKAVMIAIKSNKNITHLPCDTNDYYNNGVNYLSFSISDNNRDDYKFTTCYYGNKEIWDSTSTSEIFIPYAQLGKNDNYVSDDKLKSQLIKIIKQELISKVDSILIINHEER